MTNVSCARHHGHSSTGQYTCDRCRKVFSTWNALKEHWVQSPRHYYCQYHNRHFDHHHELVDHYLHNDHYCKLCDKPFKNEFRLHNHHNECHPRLYCAECKRLFVSEDNLRSHRRSSIHQPRNVQCPYSKCDKSFISNAALASHLETGYCPSGVSRSDVNRCVREIESYGHFPSISIDSDSEHDDAESADGFHGNRSRKCPHCDKIFKRRRDLERHLDSPVHDPKLHICPNHTCQETFGPFSSLLQHVESETCHIRPRLERRVERMWEAVLRAIVNIVNN
ncbi:hypothetical protein ID866_6895 [Astraeus odoratus]|nr:hypothetical protein ID866_6895 [Astraeus odoratus]